MQQIAFKPTTALEIFLANHGRAGTFHPDFAGLLAGSDLVVLGKPERQADERLGIALELQHIENRNRASAIAFTSINALEYHLRHHKRKSAPYAALPAADLFTMIGGKAMVSLNSATVENIFIDASGGHARIFI